MSATLLQVHIARFGVGEPVQLYALSFDGEEWFKVPRGLRDEAQNQILFKIPKAASNINGCKQSTATNSYRRFKLALENDLWGKYVDPLGDFCIAGNYLEEIEGEFRPNKTKSNTAAAAATGAKSDPTTRLLELLVEDREKAKSSGNCKAADEDPQTKLLNFFISEKQEKEKREKKVSLREAQMRVIIKKFDRKTNGEQWLIDYEQECARASINEEAMKIECLKAFLDDELHDWYDASALKLDRNDWSAWKEAFVQVFGVKGWSDVRYAYGYRYMFGSLVCYANAKEKKLLELDKKMPEIYRVNLIVYGLPREVQDRLDRKETNSVVKLLATLGEMEDGYQKKPRASQEPDNQDLNTSVSYKGRKPVRANASADKECPVCAKCGLTGRIHPIERCWTLNKFQKPKKEKARGSHEIHLSELDQENLGKIIGDGNYVQTENDGSESDSSKN